jgi:hypothetical protein
MQLIIWKHFKILVITNINRILDEIKGKLHLGNTYHSLSHLILITLKINIHYVIKSIQTPTWNCNLTPCATLPSRGHLYWVGPPFAFMTTQTLPGRISTRCLNISSGMAAHFSDRAVARAEWCGAWGLERSRRSNSSYRCSVGLRSGLWAGQSISGALLSTNHSLTDLALWQGALSCWYRQLSSVNWSSNIYSTQRVKMSLYPSVFRFPCSISRGPSPFHEKRPHTLMPPPISLFALHMLAGIVLQEFATSKPSHRTATWYSMIHHPKSHVSSCPLSSGVTLYTTLGGA